jgi:hypothetical protein
MRPLHLYRAWRNAAEPIFGRFVPSGPFSELGALPAIMKLPGGPHGEELAQILAEALAQSSLAETVRKGQSVYVLDFPGYLSIAVGAYLQLEGFRPVSLITGFYHPQAVLNGKLTLENLLYYGARLNPIAQKTPAVAFLLERERLPLGKVDNFALLKIFDNRYRVGVAYFPPFELLKELGINSFIDVRAADDEVAPDLRDFYEWAAQNDFNIYSSVVPLEGLPI